MFTLYCSTLRCLWNEKCIANKVYKHYYDYYYDELKVIVLQKRALVGIFGFKTKWNNQLTKIVVDFQSINGQKSLELYDIL